MSNTQEYDEDMFGNKLDKFNNIIEYNKPIETDDNDINDINHNDINDNLIDDEIDHKSII